MRRKGKIRSWNEQKAFGFIRPSDGGKDVFIHVSALRSRQRVPMVGEIVTYSLSKDKQGRPCAAQVLLPGDRLPVEKANASSGITGATITSVAFLGVVVFLVLTTELPWLILPGYVVVSLVTFLMYASDKSAAKQDTWRTPESTLHALSLAGGWPGALIAQQALRHKTKKQSFRFVFWITAALNCVLLVWLSMPDGAQLLP